MSLLRAVFQTGFTHHGSHLVAVAACAGMQRWALCACVQTGFTHHGSHLVAVALLPICGFAAQVAAEEAVLCPPLAIAAAMGSAPNSTRQTATATRHEVNPPTFEK